jgi:hypothetical protein
MERLQVRRTEMTIKVCSLLVLALSVAAAGQSPAGSKAPRAGTAPAVSSPQSAAPQAAQPAVAHASPTPAPTPKPGSAALSSAPISTGPTYSPHQLDFGAIDFDRTTWKTFTLTAPVAGEITLEFPTGSFRFGEFRRIPPITFGGQGTTTRAAVPPMKPTPAFSNTQTDVYKWNFAAGEGMELTIFFQTFSKNDAVNPGLRTATMKISGPGSITPWTVNILMSGTVNGSKSSTPQLAPPPTGNNSMANVATIAAGPSAAAGKFTVEDLKLRLASLHRLKVKSGALIHNPTMMASQHAAVPGGGTSAALSANPKAVSAASRSGATVPGQGQADPTALNQQAVNPCQYYGKDPVLISIDNQPGPWVFSNEPHIYRFTGCNFGSPQRILQLHFTDPSSGWTEDLPLGPTSWQNQEILASVIFEGSGGKLVPMPDINSLEILLHHESIPMKLWVLGKGKFRAVRGNPVLLTTIPQALITAFAQGSPYVQAPMTNFYGVNGAMGIVRPNLNSLIPLGQDKVNLALKSGFVIDSAQLQYLVYDNQGQGSTTTADSSHLSINGNNILINYPIDSITQNGQPFYYSIYGLKVWVVGPKDIDPWQ